MQYLFDIHCLIVCLKMDFVYRMKHVREGERRSRRKLDLSPELKTYPFETRRPKVLVQTRGRGTCACTSGGYDP